MKKIFLSGDDIIEDVKMNLKREPNMSKKQNKIYGILASVFGVLLAVLGFINLKLSFFILIASIALIYIFYFIMQLARRGKTKRITLSDFEITKQILSHKSSESFKVETGGSVSHRKTEQVDNYILYFEDGRSWQLFDYNYSSYLSDYYVYTNCHRGDSFIVVSNKNTGKIVVAYHMDRFEYKGVKNEG